MLYFTTVGIEGCYHVLFKDPVSKAMNSSHGEQVFILFSLHKDSGSSQF